MNFFAFSVSIYLKTLLSYVLYYHCIKLFLPTRRRISLQSVPASLRFSVELSPTWMLWSTFIHFQSSRIGEFSRAYTFFKNSPLVQYYLSLCIHYPLDYLFRAVHFSRIIVFIRLYLYTKYKYRVLHNRSLRFRDCCFGIRSNARSVEHAPDISEKSKNPRYW